MDDDFNISGDFAADKIKSQKDAKVFRDLKAEINKLEVEIAGKELQKQWRASKSEKVCSVSLTAKLKRNDALIADIGCQAGKTALRMDNTAVQKHDKSTQTTMIRTVNQRVQTDSLGTVTESSWARERNIERTRSGDRCRPRESSSWRPVHRRNPSRQKFFVPRWDRRREQDRSRERERARRVRHREARWSPEASRVHFPQPSKVSRQGWAISDSDSDSKLSQKFIPMNEQELDQYVKESARSGNRSPDAGCSGIGNRKKGTLDASDSEMWDAELPEKKEANFIQSDQIEPTPVLEIPPSTTLVSPPLAPPIMEQVPQMPLEEGPSQNDNREMRIVDSENKSFPSSEIMIANRQKLEEAVELEEGEYASLGGGSADNDVDHGRSSLIASDSAASERKKAAKKKKKNSKRKAKTMEDSLQSGRKKKRSKDDAENRRKLNEVPTVENYAKSKKEKLNELFGSDENVDDMVCVPPKTAERKISMGGEGSLDSSPQCLESTNEMDTSNHLTPPSTSGFGEEDSPKVLLLKEATLEEDSANTSHQDQSPMIDASLVEMPVPSLQQDQPLREASQHDQLPMDASAAKTSSPNEILPPDDPADASPARTFADASQQLKSPEVVVFSDKYGEYRVEDNNETETTIYLTRKKKKKNKSGGAS